jgi:hypothetical protein
MDFSEQWKSMQQMFLLNFHHSESMRENARRFWENQDKILENIAIGLSAATQELIRPKKLQTACAELNRWSIWFRRIRIGPRALSSA